MTTDMNDNQLLRYSRQIMLPELDIPGQQALLDATVVIIGLGGLGAPAALYLAAAGIGELVLVDDDAVELSNLQRQIIHHQSDIGQPKVSSAAGRLAGVNPEVAIRTIHDRLNDEDMRSLFSTATVIVDATDNFSSRYQINRVAWHTGTPLVSAAAIRWEGQISVFDPRVAQSPCYQCLYPSGDDQALNCAESGVVAPLVGIIGTCQALETIKLISGAGEPLIGQLLFFDSLRMDWRKLKLPKDPNCATCSG